MYQLCTVPSLILYEGFIKFPIQRLEIVKSAKLVATLNLYSAVLLISFTMSFNIFLQSEY